MKITAGAKLIIETALTKIAKLTTDINEAEARAKELAPAAGESVETKKALSVIELRVAHASKMRQSLVQITRSLQHFDGAKVELNDNESALFSYVDLS